MYDRRISTTVTRLAAWSRGAALFILVVLFLAQPMAAAADPVQGTYVGGGTGRRVQFTLHDHQRNAWAGTMRFKLDSGEELLAFCIQVDVGVSSGARYKSGGPVVDLPSGCQIANVLDKYPGSTADTGDEAAARQLAVWRFSDEVDLSTIPDDDAALRDRASAIAAEAEAGACPARRTVPPDLSLSAAGPVGKAGQRVELTVATEAVDAGQTVQARVTGPAVFDNGRQDTTVVLDPGGTGTLGVIGTGAGNMTVTAELPYRLEGGTVFAQLDDSAPSQRLVLAESRDLLATASLEGTWLEADTATPVPATGTPVPGTATAVPASPTAVATLPTGVTPTVAVATTTVVTPVAASATAAAARTTPKAGATQPVVAGATAVIPSRLPSTGRGGRDPWAVLAVVGLLVAAGVYWLRRGG